jgi:hypothetical protein
MFHIAPRGMGCPGHQNSSGAGPGCAPAVGTPSPTNANRITAQPKVRDVVVLMVAVIAAGLRTAMTFDDDETCAKRPKFRRRPRKVASMKSFTDEEMGQPLPTFS